MTAWVDPVDLASGIIVNHAGISVEESVVHWCYRDSTNLQYRRSYDEGTTFTPAVTIATSVEEIPLDRPVCSQNGVVLVFYCKQVNNAGLPPQIFMRRSTDYGNTWSAEITIDDGTGVPNNRFVRLSCAIEGDRAYVAWTTSASGGADGPIGLRRSTDAGASWAAEQNPFGSAVNPGRPDIAVNGNWVHLTWTDERDGTASGGGETYYSRSEDYGANWEAEKNLSNTASHDTLRPSIAVTGSTVFIGWQYPIFSEGIVTTQSNNNGLTFSTPATFAAGPNQEHVFVGAKGQFIAVCWTDRNTTPDSTKLRWSKDLGATFTAAETVYTPTSDTAAPLLDLGYRFVMIVDKQASDDPVLSRAPILIAEPSQATLLDDFNRADDSSPPPGANWSNGVLTFTAGEGIAIVSNQACRASAGGYRQGGWYNASRLKADQDIVAEISAWVANVANGYSLYGRMVNTDGSGKTSGYGVDLDEGGTDPITFSIWLVTRVGTTDLRIATVARPAAGDLHALTIRKELIVFWVKVSGGSWNQIGAVIDTTYSGPGYAALEFKANQETKITNLWGTEITEGSSLAWTKA